MTAAAVVPDAANPAQLTITGKNLDRANSKPVGNPGWRPLFVAPRRLLLLKFHVAVRAANL
jgi:hypothetical protein